MTQRNLDNLNVCMHFLSVVMMDRVIHQNERVKNHLYKQGRESYILETS